MATLRERLRAVEDELLDLVDACAEVEFYEGERDHAVAGIEAARWIAYEVRISVDSFTAPDPEDDEAPLSRDPDRLPDEDLED